MSGVNGLVFKRLAVLQEHLLKGKWQFRSCPAFAMKLLYDSFLTRSHPSPMHQNVQECMVYLELLGEGKLAIEAQDGSIPALS